MLHSYTKSKKESKEPNPTRKKLEELFQHFQIEFTEDGLEEVGDPVLLVLENTSYLAVQRLGRGEEGAVFKLISCERQNETYALKVYKKNALNSIKGDELIFNKAIVARPYLNMPLAVNTETGYTISPLLRSHFTCENSPEFTNKMIELHKKLKVALKVDGLTLGDNLNPGNYVSDIDGSLKRIDFASAKEIPSSTNKIQVNRI